MIVGSALLVVNRAQIVQTKPQAYLKVVEIDKQRHPNKDI